MKMKKYLVSLVLAMITLVTVVVPAQSVQAQTTQEDAVYDKIKESGEFVVGLSADYAPYEFHADVNGQDTIVGFDVSIARKIASDMGVKLKIEELGFDALLGALKTGKVDAVISGMSPTQERLKEVDFSDSYLRVDQKVVVRKADKNKFNSTKDFKGVGVAAQKQTIQEALIKTEMTGAKGTSLQRVPDLIMNLTNKKVDAAVLEAPVALAYIQNNKELAIADVTFENGEKDTSVAIAKNTPVLKEKINASIKIINDNNLMDGYQKKANQLMLQDNKTFIQKYGPNYLKGAGYTILLAIFGVVFGAILGAVLALVKLSKVKVLRVLATIYIEYVRGTPLLVQIFIVYFGTGVLGFNLSKMAAGSIALALNSGAYVAEIIRAGINAVDNGQLEAARSLGMNQGRALRFIIMPQAIKNILPALGNEFVTVIKESSVVSVIGVSELIFQTGVIQGASFKPFLPYLIVSLIYFVLTFVISRALGVAERRMRTSD
jgi:polar amino acid transport system substrate-binding protein